MAEEEKKEETKDEQPKESEIRERFGKDFEIAKKFNEPIHALMDRYYEMYRNRDQLDSDFRVSDLFAYVETVVPILTNNRVRGQTKAEYPEYVKHAEGMGYILDHTFDVNDWDYNAQRIAKMAEIYRYSLAYTGYDAEAKNGAGKLCIYEINPRWCYVDPAVTDLQDSSFFIYVEPMRVTKAIKKHPKKADDIRTSINRKDRDRSDNSKQRNWFQTLYTSVRNFLNVNTSNNTAVDSMSGLSIFSELDEAEKRKESVAYIHYWYRDDEDKWRVAYWADDVLLEDRENPFLHGKLPYVPYVPCDDILSAVGVPIAEHIDNLNTERNVLIGEIVKNVKRANKPPAIRNTAFGNPQNVEAMNDPQHGKEVILVNNPDMVPLNAIFDYLNMPQIPNGAFNLNEIFVQLEDKLLGTNDTMRGMGNATSGKEVQLKQEAAYTRIKTKIDNYEKFIKQLSEMIIVNAMQFYEENRAFRVKGDYRQYQDINEDDTPFNVEPIQRGTETVEQGGEQVQQPVYDKKEFFLYANPNEWTKIMEPEEDEEGNPVYEGEDNKQKVKEASRILQFVVEIEAGSSLPTSRSARREEAMELFNAQAVDQQYILEAYEVPGADAIMRRMQEAAQAAQQAQMQAEQGNLQLEQEKMKMDMELKKLEIQSKIGQTQMNNDAKFQHVQSKSQPQQPDVASELDKIRSAVPELSELSDEELMAHIAKNVQIPA